MSSNHDSLNSRYTALLAVLDNAADAIISIDKDGRVLTFNPAGERMFQFSSEEIVGENIAKLMPQAIGSSHDGYVGNYLLTGNSRIIGVGRDVHCRRKDGSTFVANLSISESLADGEVIFTGILRDLTEQNAIRQRIESLGGILENSLSAIYVIQPDALRISYANQAAWQAWDEIQADRHDAPLQEMFDEKSCRTFAGAIDDFRTGASKTRDFAATAMRKDKSRYAVQVHLFAGEYAGQKVAIASVLDVSEQQKAEAELHLKELEQQLILRYAPIGIALMNPQGLLFSINEAAARITGYAENELLGRSGLRFMHTDEQMGMRHLFGRLIDDELAYSSSTHRLRHASGHYVPIKTYNAAVHDETTQTTTLICMFEDLSEQREKERELQMERERLAHASRLTQMGEMAAGLAHELNQPLAAIRTYASAGKRMIDNDTPHAGDLLEACERIGMQAKRAGDVIRRIRSLTTRHQTRHQVCDINAIIRNLITLVEIDLRHTNAEIRVDTHGVLNVMADQVQVEQVLLNFLRNAIDAVAPLPMQRQRITLRARSADGQVRVEVIDCGGGVPQERKQTLFDAFVSDKKTGMGMGLSISKSIVEMHGGKIGVDDNVPQGAVFWFTLPEYTRATESAE